jgi:hypothetical protein
MVRGLHYFAGKTSKFACTNVSGSSSWGRLSPALATIRCARRLENLDACALPSVTGIDAVGVAVQRDCRHGDDRLARKVVLDVLVGAPSTRP